MVALCLDFGNTRKKAAVFYNDVFVEEILLENDENITIEKLLATHKPQFSIMSSVIQHNSAIETILAAHTSFHKIGVETKCNFTTPVGTPSSIGADRLALCAAAAHFYPNKNNLVIGLGTCVTYNFINQKQQFLGGAISPGLHMRFKAMHEHTALLPLQQPSFNFPLIGYNTNTNLQSGVLFGLMHEIEGFIRQYEAKFANFNVVLTGGDAIYFAKQLKYKIFADPNFLFKGMYALSQLNNRYA
jgi:type III pantothenate kinase